MIDNNTFNTFSTPPLPRAHISQPDGTFGMKVKRCFSFSDQNSTVELVDERGCPEPTIMSEFRCWVDYRVELTNIEYSVLTI